ncbi:Tn3 family transposase [Dysgonomonas sp.]
MYLKNSAKEELNEEHLKHISPLNWAHINFLGEYAFDAKNTPKDNKLRDLNNL